ncbi:hypothetical protein C5L14_04285 [Labrys okinawensis]|uniref:Uncharacterized protein n=1 Tax=Labrys okinawensis TaxID=346911 RepID=A0A2S9QGK1_9HYPH|nr:hypothetical protein C5L14_04285 [Labrys okinawensis]
MTHGLPDSQSKDRHVGDTKKKIYEYLIEGATSGLSDEALYTYIVGRVSKANSKRIARAGFLALSDPTLTDRNVLNTIYALAIKHRLADSSAEEAEETAEERPRKPKASGAKASNSKAASLPLPDKKPKKS